MIMIDYKALYKKYVEDANFSTENMIEGISSWYKNFNATETKTCLKNSASQTSSWVNKQTSQFASEQIATIVAQFDSKFQEMLGQDFTSTDGDL